MLERRTRNVDRGITAITVGEHWQLADNTEWWSSTGGIKVWDKMSESYSCQPTLDMADRDGSGPPTAKVKFVQNTIGA